MRKEAPAQRGMERFAACAHGRRHAPGCDRVEHQAVHEVEQLFQAAAAEKQAMIVQSVA